jgi:hypothetical protein
LLSTVKSWYPNKITWEVTIIIKLLAILWSKKRKLECTFTTKVHCYKISFLGYEHNEICAVSLRIDYVLIIASYNDSTIRFNWNLSQSCIFKLVNRIEINPSLVWIFAVKDQVQSCCIIFTLRCHQSLQTLNTWSCSNKLRSQCQHWSYQQNERN